MELNDFSICNLASRRVIPSKHNTCVHQMRVCWLQANCSTD